MSGSSPLSTKAQLDKSEREHLEDVVIDLRETVEADIKYQLEHTYALNSKEGGENLSEEKSETRTELVKAVRREDGDKSWEEKFEQYVMGVGYTIVNRITALRCMEVRGFIDRPVTQFGKSDTTPAAEKIETEEFLSPEEAIIEAYERECARLTDEIEILFDPDSPYSIIDLDVDIFEELCRKLDEVPNEVWRADDVLGWVYEYYNTNQLSAVRERMRTGQFDSEDVAVANQFYTPHWVARLLTDNAVGKPYLQATNELDACIERQQDLSPNQRSERNPEYNSTPSISELCTYLTPSSGEVPIPNQHPSELRILDPACGSGHFLLYAFDVLERIWRDSTDVSPGKIPVKILEHNLYGIDIDMRACQLAAFNLYLKARHRAVREGNSSFEMPTVGIVCADSQIPDTSEAQEIIETLAKSNVDFADALEKVLKDFQDKKGLGSLLNVRGTLESAAASDQTELTDWVAEIPSLSDWIERLHKEVEEKENNRFLYQDLHSFLRLIILLTEKYDAILMNPPYGGHRRMPKQVKEYVGDHYQFKQEYYVNFLEQSERLLKPNGRIGMLVPRSFMYKDSFEDVRSEMIKSNGDYNFDFLVEFGKGILDNATVRTVGTVLTKNKSQQQEVGEFIQLSDVDATRKKEVFARVLSGDESLQWRHHTVDITEFQKIPGGMLTYWAPSSLRELYTNNVIFDADQAGLSRGSVGSAKKGIDTGKNARFVRYSWECDARSNDWWSYAKGGKRSWFYYPTTYQVLWGENGEEIKRYDSSTIRNEEYIGQPAVTWPMIKESGHRFGFFEGGVSDNVGPCFYPDDESIHYLTGLLNSSIYTGLMLAQTPERNWFLSDIAILPYFEFDNDVKSQIEDTSSHLTDLVSTFESFYLQSGRYEETLKEYNDFDGFVNSRKDRIEKLFDKMREEKSKIDVLVANELNIGDEVIGQIIREAELRYGDYEPIPYGPEKIDTTNDAFCHRLLSFIILKIVEQTDDGIVNISEGFSRGSYLYEGIVDEIGTLFESPPDQVLAQIDRNLGNRSAESQAYPNIDCWINDDFFPNHLSEFNSAPIIWQIETSRLVSDSSEAGFKCLIDYNKIDSSLFDRLETQYLDPLKAEYRDHRNAADQRRSDSSLSTTEQAEAAEEYNRYESALTQISEFQGAALKLSSEHPRDHDEEVQNLAEGLAPKVAEFRERTEERLETLDELVEDMEPDQFEDLFSPTFLERVNENRTEWINALNDLENACIAYGKDADQPVEAHHYDLFPNFDNLVGSTHYGSNGIFFMNYYFSKGKDYLEKGEPREGLAKETELLAKLAMETDEDVELGKEIKEGCNELSKEIPSEWRERALAEVMTAGYNPVKKHGVAINIKPLADKKLVPESVENRVL